MGVNVSLQDCEHKYLLYSPTLISLRESIALPTKDVLPQSHTQELKVAGTWLAEDFKKEVKIKLCFEGRIEINKVESRGE